MASDLLNMVYYSNYLCVNLFSSNALIFVGGAPPTLLSCSEQRFGTKSDVTLFLKQVDRRITIIESPWVALNIPDTI